MIIDRPRLEDWPERMEAAIARHAGLPMEYGGSDCFRMPQDNVVAVIGLDPWKDVGKYNSEKTAARQLAKRGHASLAEAFAEFFAEWQHYSQARRGDIGVIERDGLWSGVIVTGRFVVGKHPIEGFKRVAIELMTRSFRVGR